MERESVLFVRKKDLKLKLRDEYSVLLRLGVLDYLLYLIYLAIAINHCGTTYTCIIISIALA